MGQKPYSRNVGTCPAHQPSASAQMAITNTNNKVVAEVSDREMQRKLWDLVTTEDFVRRLRSGFIEINPQRTEC